MSRADWPCVACEVDGHPNVPAHECRVCGMALCAAHAAEPCAPKCVAALHERRGPPSSPSRRSSSKRPVH